MAAEDTQAATAEGTQAVADRRIAAVTTGTRERVIGTDGINANSTKGKNSMPQTSPWNSVKENHHHNNTKCGPGSEIPAHNRQSGTGGKPLCKDCKKLNDEGK